MKICFEYGTERLIGRWGALYLACGTFDMNSTRADKVEALDTTTPDPKAVQAIGRALEAHYSNLVRAPLPDKFVELLARLERDQVSRTKGRPDALS
jgi:hypothetical protein